MEQRQASRYPDDMLSLTHENTRAIINHVTASIIFNCEKLLTYYYIQFTNAESHMSALQKKNINKEKKLQGMRNPKVKQITADILDF